MRCDAFLNWLRRTLLALPRANQTVGLSRLKLTSPQEFKGIRTAVRLLACLTMISTASCANRPSECSWAVKCPDSEIVELLPYSGDAARDKKIRKVKEDCALQNRGYRRHCGQ